MAAPAPVANLSVAVNATTTIVTATFDPSADANFDYYELRRSSDGGAAVNVGRSYTRGDMGNRPTVQDASGAQGKAYTYSVYVHSTTGGYSVATVDPAAPLTVPNDDAWRLVSLTAADTIAPLPSVSAFSQACPMPLEVKTPVNQATSPIVVVGHLALARGTLTLQVLAAQAITLPATLRTIASNPYGHTVYLKSPFGESRKVVLGQIDETRGQTPGSRDVTVPWYQVA